MNAFVLTLARRRCKRPLLLCLLLALAFPAAGSSAEQDILRAVPDDVGFCLIVRDLRRHASELAASPFVKRLRTSTLAVSLLNSSEAKQLLANVRQFEQFLGTDLDRIRDEILGDQLALAYRPGPPNQAAQEQALLLVRARDVQLLAALIERINKAQQESGELKELRSREHQGKRYVQRIEKQSESYYFVDGTLFLFANREPILQQALDRLQETAPSNIARRLKELGADRQLATLWINPRAFDAEMAANLAQSTEKLAVFLRTFSQYWKAIDGIAFCLDTADALTFELAIQTRVDQLPAAARRFFAAAAVPSTLWSRFPDHAMLALAVRADLSALLSLLGEFATPADRQAVQAYLERTLGVPAGKDFVREVLPGVGPDLGLCIAAPPTGEPEWFPQAFFAIAVRPADNQAPSIEQAVLAAVDFYAQLAVVAQNRPSAEALILKTAPYDKTRVKYLTGDPRFPPGLQPAYGVRRGFLLFASSPDVIRRFGEDDRPGTQGEQVPLLRLSLKACSRYLADRRNSLVDYVSAQNATSREEVNAKLQGIITFLELFDQVEIKHHSTAGQLRFFMRLQLADSLR